MTPFRGPARAAAMLYLITWITSVAAVPLYGGSALDGSASLAARSSVLVAAMLEVVLAVAVVGTAVALYPLLRPHGPGAAVGYAVLRTLEASVILVGVVAILPAVARPATTGGPAVDPAVAQGLHLMHDWTFLIGPGLINPVTALVLAGLLWREHLVPRFIPMLGIGGSVLVAGQNLAVIFGLISPLPLLAIPLFLWEICLAIRLFVRGLPAPEPALTRPLLPAREPAPAA